MSSLAFESYPLLSVTEPGLFCWPHAATTNRDGATKVSPTELGAASKNSQRFLQGSARTLFSTPAPVSRFREKDIQMIDNGAEGAP